MISIILKTAEYRGDHSADVSIAHELRDGESVVELVARLLESPEQVLELRLVQKSK